MRLIKFFIFSICFIITSSGFAQTDIQRLDKILEQVKQTVDANPAKCLELCNEGLKINKQVGLAKFDGKFYGYLGILYQDLGNYQKAVDCLLKSRKAALESNDQQALISAEVNIGGVYFYEGKYEEALKQFIHAGEMARNFKDYTQAGSIVGNIAAIHLQLKQYDKALAYFQLAEKDFIISHDSDMLATNYQNVGQVLSQTFRYDTALKLLQVALDIAKKKQNETIQARININIGSIYIELKQYGKAKIYIEEALALHEHQGDSNYLVDAYCNLSEVNRMLGQKDIALDAGKHAFDIASRLRSNHWLQIACANLDKAYSAFGDYKNAYQYGQLSAAYNDSILNEQKTKEIQKLQIGFETKKKRTRNSQT
ncbi:MAG: tetratricopeptide repeat protein [Bacteroidota bacterium]|nr:tetratricopeptide repeat protein [Bacteroidota bacterium]